MAWKPKIPHRFKPGVSGNPAGRPPKADALNTMFEEALNQMYSVQMKTNELRKTYKRRAVELIIQKAVMQAIGGKADARNFLFDRYYGKPKESIEYEEKKAIADISKEELEKLLDGIKESDIKLVEEEVQ